ncbi:hypothetical protein [Fulvimarina sp. MAC3]|uniref:hypothetical protein n=1 Tax=Fulvimarina sp. MAC3 TaxID=3148887 RepID=UPI0031FCEE16
METTEPITRSALEVRLNPLGWPVEADASEHYIQPYNAAAGEAQAVYEAFQKASAEAANNPGLTDIGRRQAAHDWAEKHLPALREKLARIRSSAAETIENAGKSMTAAFTAPAEEPQDIAMLQEVRSWLRTMPENQRTMKVVELARAGDRTALRAVLTAPSYLTGVDHDLLTQVRDIVSEADHPERFAKVQAVKKAATYSERALDGVIRFIEQEGTVLGKRPGSTDTAVRLPRSA